MRMIAMTRTMLQQRSALFWSSVFLIVTLFALPLSSTGKSIFVVLSVGSILCIKDYRRDLLRVIEQPWCQAALLLYGIALIACAWSPVSFHEQFPLIEKYNKLLFLPILTVGFRDPHVRRAGLNAFLLAMVVTCLVSIMRSKGVIPLDSVDPSKVFRNHIMTSYMMAFAVYVAALLGVAEQGGWRRRAVYVVLVALFSYQVLMINNGRTGYVLYLVLMALFMVQHFPWRQSIIALVVSCSVFVMVYHQSPVMQDRVHEAIQDVKSYRQQADKNTPIGYRFQFHDYAHQLFNRHPWLGNGTGAFAYLFHKEDPVPARGNHVNEPHSQYWLVASEFGVVGLGALFLFFACLVVASCRLRQMRPIAFATLLAFLLGNLSDSLLLYSGSGYFFILFMALCLGEQVGRRSDDTISSD